MHSLIHGEPACRSPIIPSHGSLCARFPAATLAPLLFRPRGAHGVLSCTPARTAPRRPACAGHRGAPFLLVLVGSSGQPPVQIGRGGLPPQRVPEPAAAQVCAATSAPRARVRARPAAAPAAQRGPARIPAPPGPGRGPELALALPAAAAAAGAAGRRRVECQVAEELVAHMALRARVPARPGAAPAQRQGGSKQGCRRICTEEVALGNTPAAVLRSLYAGRPPWSYPAAAPSKHPVPWLLL